MQYSPKLKKATEEISKILEKHDIAGMIVLHTPGHSEYLLKIDPSYSCAQLSGDGLRVRARLKEDFNGDVAKFTQVKTDTSNMLELLSHTTGQMALNLMETADAVSKQTGSTHTGGSHTSSTTQNN